MAKKKTVSRTDKQAGQSTAERESLPPASNSNKVVLRDRGLVEIEIQGGAHDGEIITRDLLQIKMAAEPVEAKFRQANSELFQPSYAFFLALSEAYVRDGILPVCTPMMAANLWGRVWNDWTELKKNG